MPASGERDRDPSELGGDVALPAAVAVAPGAALLPGSGTDLGSVLTSPPPGSRMTPSPGEGPRHHDWGDRPWPMLRQRGGRPPTRRRGRLLPGGVPPHRAHPSGCRSGWVRIPPNRH
eukprot:12768576-Alexandrium_andersonii.AAC.1